MDTLVMHRTLTEAGMPSGQADAVIRVVKGGMVIDRERVGLLRQHRLQRLLAARATEGAGVGGGEPASAPARRHSGPGNRTGRAVEFPCTTRTLWNVAPLSHPHLSAGSILALREAQGRGAEDALMLNTAGRLACGTTANLFLVHDGTLLTPSLEEGALPGITRALVLELAPGLGIVTRETPLEPALLAQAQEAILTSSLRLLTPLASIEGRPLGAPGKLARALTAALRRAASP